MMDLTKEQRLRYARNISVGEIGEAGQARLLGSSVFMLGCGALGSIVGAYLAGAGVGRLTIADFDTVDIVNLQRQILYRETDAGESKAQTLAQRLRQINGSATIEPLRELITEKNAPQLFLGHDFIVDASDNPDTKYLVDRVCFEMGLPYSVAGVLGFGGQVMTHVPGTARYIDFFPQSAGAGFTPCSVGGILGPVAGMIASVQALEAIKYLTGTGGLLTDRLLVVDGLNMKTLQIGS